MDRANFALVSRLLDTRREVHVVGHGIADSLCARGVQCRKVWRPGGSHSLGMPLLARAGARHARLLAQGGAHVIVNGGNCTVPAVNWVHYVHAAYAPAADATGSARLLAVMQRRYVLDRERQALGAAHLIICNSERTQKDLIRRAGVDAARTRVLYYGSDPASFGPVSEGERAEARSQLGLDVDRPVALFVGALGDRRKGFDALFDSWVSLLASGWDADLIVAGAGRELNAWRNRARDARFDHRIHMLGYRTDVSRLLAAADLLVHPARYEAYGLSVHEAICRGVPAIVARDAGVAERYPSSLRGLLLPEISTTAIRDALIAWSVDRGRIRAETCTLGNAWRARTWDDMADELIATVEGN